MGVIAFTVGLCIVGMISGVLAAVTAQGRKAASRVVDPQPRGEIVAAPATSTMPMTSVASSDSAAPRSSAAAVASAAVIRPDVSADPPPATEAKFVKTIEVRLDAPPASIVFSADESLFFVLVDDGTVRAHDATTGTEKRRVKLSGRGKSLVSLPGSRVAVLGLPAELVVIDEVAWAGGSAEAQFLKRIVLRDVIDLVAVGEPPRMVAVLGQGGRVVRLSSDLSAIEAEFVSVPPVQSLATLRDGAGAERLVMLVPGRPLADAGAVFLCDPTVDPFGASRAMWSAVTDPRVSSRVGTDKLLMFDAATATVIDFSLGAERRVAPAGSLPMAAFRWSGDRAVVVGAAGNAAVVSFGRRREESTVSLGGIPSAAVATPDRRVVVVALGGGVRGRGTKTVVLAGEPLAVESTVETGDGSHIVAIAPKGAVIAVGAIAGRAVTLLARK